MILRAVALVVVIATKAGAGAGAGAGATRYSPFEPAQAIRHHEGYLFQRQDQCLSSQNFCPATDGNSGCCSTDTLCATDDAGQVACCPTRAICTGALGGAAATGSPAATQASGATTAAPQPTPMAGEDGGGAIVANAYFPYVYLPTTYANAELCTSAFSSCRSEFSVCTSSLETRGNGVTISGAGGGITAQPALGPASAGSICSSLSTRACYNLGLGNCPMYGSAAVRTGTFDAGSAAPTRCAQIYQVVVAVAVGVAGQAIR